MSSEGILQIGPYEITREIGRGGMGVVYLAHDSKLDRDVAIKCLPDDFTDDEERLSRFQREAKALAALNHTNIASIYGLEELDSRQYLILEYVPGDTLNQVLDHGPMPVREVLPIAKQIAEAIEAAHSNGIIHRDLKPANIKFASDDQVKVLDFGLAKAFDETPSSASEVAASPTYIPTNTPTMPGVVLGTAGYLSPEQARGRTVDKRTDIFSFGCVLYEMLAGKTVFPGETVTDSLGATIHKDPNWDELPKDTPPTIQLLLRRCLQKDRRRRLRDIGDACIELEQAIEDPTSTSLGLAAFALGSTKSPRLAASHFAAAVILILIAAISAWVFKPAPEIAPKQVVRLSIDLGESTHSTSLSISPDGTRLVYSAKSAIPDPDGVKDQTQLWLRRLDTFEATPIPNTQGGEAPSFSPDGTRILFSVDKQLSTTIRKADLRIVELDGRAPLTVTSNASNRIEPRWISDDELAFFDANDGRRLMRISARGGEPKLIVELKTSDAGPIIAISVLPGAKWIAVSYLDILDTLSFGVKLVELATGEIHPFLENAIGPIFINDGPVLFYKSGTVVAGDIDMTSHPPTVSSNLITVLNGLSTKLRGTDVEVSQNGHLVLVEGIDDIQTTLAVVDSTGKIEDYTAEARSYAAADSFSTDGNRLAYTAIIGEERIPEIWVMELDTGSVRRISNEGEISLMGHWLPDGRLVYSHIIGPREAELLVVEIHRNAKPQLLFADDADQQLAAGEIMESFDITPDGTVVVYTSKTKDREDTDIWMRAVDGSDDPRPLLESTAIEILPRISPDGKWLSFQSDESGRLEVYVKQLVSNGDQDDPIIRISKAGGIKGVWSGDMTSIFYMDPKSTSLFVAEIEITQGKLKPSEPKLVSDMKSLNVRQWMLPFLPIPDSDKLLYVKKSQDDKRNNRIDIVLNWLEEYKANKVQTP